MRAYALFLSILVLVLTAKTTAAQLNVVSPSAPCGCDASFTYSPASGIGTFFILSDTDGNTLESGFSANGTWQSNNLCQGIYLITANVAGTNYSQVIQINHPSYSPGLIGETTLCSSGSSVNLSTFISGFQSGGIWTTPAGTPFNGTYNPTTFSPGFYQYSMNISGCTYYSGVTVTEIQNANPGIQTTYLICDTYTPFEMYDFLEGNPDPGGTWFNASNQPMNGVYDPSTMSSGLFVYAINNVPGCNTVFTTMFVDERATPSAGENSSLVVCNGASPFDLFPHIPGNPDTGGFWFRPNGLPFNGNFQPGIDPAGNYRYVVTANAPCEDQESIISISYSNVDPSGLSASLTICESQPSVNLFSILNGAPQSNGVWSTSTGIIFDGVYNPQTMQSGVFNYYVNNVGCSSSGSNVTVNELAAGEAGDDITTEICLTDSPLDLTDLLTSNADAGGQFRNEFGEIINETITFSNTQLLQFTYEVITPSCPTDIATIIIAVVAPPIQPQPLNAQVCNEVGTIDLNAFYPQISFPTWQDEDGDIVSEQFQSTVGTHQFTITSNSNNACPSYSSSFAITINQPLFPHLIVAEQVCISDSPIDLNNYISPSFTALGQWVNEQGNTISPLYTLQNAGSETLYFIGLANGICPLDSIEIEVEIFPERNAGADQTITVCENDPPILLMDLLSPGVDQGLWQLNNLNYNQSTFIPIANTNNHFDFIVAANEGCPSDTAHIEINVQEGFSLDAGFSQSICAGSSPLEIGTTAMSETSYSWSPTTNLSNALSANTQVIVPSDIAFPQSTTYTLTAQQGVCTASDEITIETLPAASVNIGDEMIVCLGQSLVLEVPNAFQAEWSPSFLFSNTAATSQLIFPENNVTVEVLVTNAFGCQATDQLEIMVQPLPTVNYTAPPFNGCSPVIAEDFWSESTGNPLTVRWSIEGEAGFQFGSEYSFQLDDPGVYDLTLHVTDENGCAVDTVYEDIIEVYGYPVAHFTMGPEQLSMLNSTVSFANSSVGGISYLWDFGTGATSQQFEPIFTFPDSQSGSYDVCLQATSSFGCVHQYCDNVRVESDQIIYVPNAFTPNDDGINDIFIPRLLGFDANTYRLLIFDRWGKLVFSTNDFTEAWIGNVDDGTHYGMNESYNWVIEVKLSSGADIRRFEGHVMLLR